MAVGLEEMGWLKEAPNLFLPFPSLATLFSSSLHLFPAERPGSKTRQEQWDGTSPIPGTHCPASLREWDGLEVCAVNQAHPAASPLPILDIPMLPKSLFLRRATPTGPGGRMVVFILCNLRAHSPKMNHPLIGEGNIISVCIVSTG